MQAKKIAIVYNIQKFHMKFSTHVSLMLTHIRNWSFLGAYLRIISTYAAVFKVPQICGNPTFQKK